MKFQIRIYRKITIALLAACLLGAAGCEIDEIKDPNGPSLSALINNASRSDLNSVVSGIEFLMINDVDFYYDATGIIGREFYFFTSADTRFTGELLGKGSQLLDNAGFYGTRPYQGRYRAIKNTNILVEAVDNNASKIGLTAQEANGYKGFAKAMQAYELHLALMLQYQNGIRTNVADFDNPGPFVSYDQALIDIRALLDESISLLSSAEITFPLSPGYDDFNSSATFAQFVNGIAARIAIYQDDKSGALNYLNNSFMDLNGNFDAGPARFYSAAGGEQINELFRPLDQAEALVAHPEIIEDLTGSPNDLRNAKIVQRSASVSSDGLTSDHDVSVYRSLDANVPLIRNEELILLYAEANIGSNNAEALTALNRVRMGNGIPAVTLTTDAELVDELLEQRKLSLFYEGHRWVDMRRYDRLSQLPLDREGDDVWVQMPRPVSEIE
jgi:hypothetical protein